MLGSLTTEVSMEFGELIFFYATQVTVYVDELNKVDLLVLLGAYLLGHYMGSKRNGTSKRGNNPV